MSVIQLSAFIENKTGRIAELAEALADSGLNIRGFSVSDTAQYGIVRVVVDDPLRGAEVLKAAGFTVTPTRVIVIDLTEDKPGLLASVLRLMSDSNINVEYIYSLIAKLLAVNVSDVEEAEELLQKAQVKMLSHADLSNI